MTVPSSPCTRFQDLRASLASALIEREEEIDLALTALIAGEHVLLVGPPGTAKSLLLDSLLRWTSGRRFTALLTRFSTPEELFGPISVRGLKEDRYRRITAGKLPEAHLAFLDEIFKASSAILNTLLRLLNERVFEDGDGGLVKVPLLLCLAASNEWPDAQEGGRELAAVFDRFLFRRQVRPILSQAGRQRLLWTRDHEPVLESCITPEEIHQARREARTLPWSDEAKQALEAILRELAREGIQPGDRRQFKSVAAVQALAYLAGAERVEPDHLEVLASVLWDDPQEQPEKVASIIARIASPTGMRVNGLLLECESILASTEPRDLARAATAAAKLAEVEKSLAALRSDARVERARSHVREQARKLRLASIDAL